MQNIQWLDKAKIILKDFYTMNLNKINPCIKKFEFLIHYAEKVGS